PRLATQFSKEIHSGKLEVVHGDILDLLSDKNHKPQTINYYKVVANIPYYITGQLLRLLLSCNDQPSSITLVVQKEVAQRIVAKDGKESILSLSVKVYGEPKFIQKIPARYFNPQPKVDSAIIHISDISKDNFTSKKQEQLFFTILKAGFAHKRKLLSKNLEEVLDKESVQELFDHCNIPTNTRAEDVPLEKWLEILKSI
ncbi:MAG: 16S rRNA (adenine(1518)-N(6)/adenine(1519)-N(6))-dimethyltransferase, partial [Candidatus Pacebacteria bacterium]|nr:16S rRNA (adenine(1518)-N(6)/adenine(1519)-N(6))-dimethyltransferase [Candidatus Paceibacterota bacterium]